MLAKQRRLVGGCFRRPHTTMSSVGDGDQLMITNAGVAGCTVGDCSMSLDEGEATDSGLSSIGNNVFLCEGGCVT